MIFLASLLHVLNASAQIFQPSKVDHALEIIKYYYVDTVNDKKLMEEAVRSVIKELDPHSVYIPLEELREMNEPLVGKFEGIGIQFNIHEDTIMVTATIPGGPSEKLGIKAGDRIVNINDTNVAGVKITNNDVLKKLRGDKGTKVRVDIFRKGSAKLLTYVITRDQIPLFSVDASYMVEPGIGYIKISRFADATVDEFRKALASLKSQGMESLVLDLQGNGGGYLNRAVELSDEFLTAGKKIVFTRGRSNPDEDFMSSNQGGWEKGKLAILIDQYSASASEIVSGAVQDWDRGLIIGRRSFGKGLVQKPFQLPDGSLIRLTVAHYYTPSGRNIQRHYELGKEDEYAKDFSERSARGEWFHEDSIQYSDTTKYFTNAKRVVRGGGGIMPDIFVPIDTSLYSDYYSNLLRSGVMNEFPLTYVDNNRNELKSSYGNVEAFKNAFVIDDKIMNDFLNVAEKMGAKMDSAGYQISEPFIKLQLKALIARNLWDTNAFYVIINDNNMPLRKAVDAIRGKTFEKMKLAGN
ncbi:MAG: S41 family peptidase [Bacteroidetes bacterium]|nr:MAG: S41 family peptidase [Bacteroidota bacterium]REK07083.1 MAG: S41 family peptidase [Bacteroidota bacterium]REK33742.1 MAG: S41 family peptidase [Bacteroidota bacterium]REK48658.1 MAG: S41 family peptidase [Bacteroidota bacterium]